MFFLRPVSYQALVSSLIASKMGNFGLLAASRVFRAVLKAVIGKPNILLLRAFEGKAYMPMLKAFEVIMLFEAQTSV